jgi:hypothetical protein
LSDEGLSQHKLRILTVREQGSAFRKEDVEAIFNEEVEAAKL